MKSFLQRARIANRLARLLSDLLASSSRASSIPNPSSPAVLFPASSFLNNCDYRSRRSQSRAGKHQQNGFVLLSVLFLVALIVLSLSLAAPRIAEDIRRDRENELYHRGMQYQRAIKLYYRRFGRYPVSLEQLEKTNEIRFLRKRYKDPITGKDEWRLIHFGQAKVPAMGLFGQSLAVGVPAGSLGSQMNNPGNSASSPGGLSGGFGSSSTSPVATGTPVAGDGGTTGTNPPGTGDTGSTGPGGLTNPGSNGPGSSGFGSNGPGSTGFGSTTQPLGGGPIVGIASTSTKESIRIYRKQTHYNEWEFVYDPAQERTPLSGTTGGNPVTPLGSSGGGQFGSGGSSGPGVGLGGPGVGVGGTGGGTPPPPAPPVNSPQ